MNYLSHPFGGTYKFQNQRVSYQPRKIFDDLFIVRLRRISTNVDHEVIIGNCAEDNLSLRLTEEMIGEKVQGNGELPGRKIKRMISEKLPNKNLKITVLEFRYPKNVEELNKPRDELLEYTSVYLFYEVNLYADGWTRETRLDVTYYNHVTSSEKKVTLTKVFVRNYQLGRPIIGPYIREVKLTEADVNWAGSGELLSQDDDVFLATMDSDQIAVDLAMSSQDEEEKWLREQAVKDQFAEQRSQKKIRPCVKFKMTQCEKYLNSSSASWKHS